MDQLYNFFRILISDFLIFRCLEEDPEANAEMQFEQALDENDLMYHDAMISANS